MRKSFKKIRSGLITSLLAFSVIATSAVFPLSADAAAFGNEREENYTIDKSQFGGYIKPSAIAVPAEEDSDAKSSPVLRDGVTTDDFWSKMSSSYYGSQLSGNARTLYDNMEREAKALMENDGDLGETAGDAAYSGMTPEEAMDIALCFEEDHPQYFFMRGVHVSFYKDSGTIHFDIIDKYRNGAARSDMKAKLREKITAVTSAAEKEKTPYEKEKYIHDYIVNNTSYDTASASNGEDEQKMDSALINGKSVCAGYASAFQAMCNEVGIETIAVTSTNHKWVEVKLDRKWYAVDVTWDDPIGYSGNTVSHRCFNISDEELLKIDADPGANGTHVCNKIWDETFKRPACVSGTYDPAKSKPEDTGSSDTGKTDTKPDTQPEKKPSITYRTHVENIGWQDYVADGKLAGTTGKALRLEAMNIKLDTGDLTGGIEYSTHIQNIGWQDWKKNNELTGTTGKALRLEAIKIKLTGEIADKYNIYYCVHAQNFGWLNWAKNGEEAGTAGYAYRLEAIRMVLVPKGKEPEELTGMQKCRYYHPFVSYRTHVQNVGWQGYVKDGSLAGTTGRSLRLEGLNIRLDNQEYTGDIVYSTHVQNIGWQKPVKDDAMAGTQGKALRLEAVTINLTGDMAEHYDVCYRTHVQNIGWTGWAKNGAKCGSEGMALRLEGLEVQLVPKGTNLNKSNEKAFYKS